MVADGIVPLQRWGGSGLMVTVGPPPLRSYARRRRWRKYMLAAPAAIAALFAAGQIYSSLAKEPKVSVLLDPALLAPRAKPMTVGVGVHFGIGGEYGYDPVRSAKAIDDMGFDSFRDDLSWRGFDKAGITPKLAGFMNLTRARPLLILTAWNEDQPGGPVPLGAAARAAFADFGVKAARDMARRQAPMVEIGNEWNLGAARDLPRFTDEGRAGDPRSAANYAPLAQAGVTAIRRSVPGAQILVGAAGIDPEWKWVSGVVRRGGLRGADGLSVHIYNQCEARTNDRTAAQALWQLDRLKQALVPSTVAKMPSVYVTEVGWPTATSCVVSPQLQAANMAQFLLWTSAMPWVRGVWLYQLKDQGQRPAEIEDNFGLYNYDYRPKPAACTTRESIQLIRSATRSRAIRVNAQVFLIHLATKNGPRLLAWTAYPDQKAILSLDSKTPVVAQPLCGARQPAAQSITIGQMPVVITLPQQQQAMRLTVEAG